MPDNKRWIVTVSPDEPLPRVRRGLEDAGFAVREVMEAIGVVTGDADDDAARRIRDLKGVRDVSPDGAVDIGPPDAPSTW
jgi:hypothetical protein